MKNKLTCVVISVVILFYGLTVNAASLTEKIEVIKNAVTLSVNGEDTLTETILYNGATYIPLRTTAELLGLDVDWLNDSQCAVIEGTPEFNESNGLKLLEMYPRDGGEGVFLKWGYITLAFNQEMKNSSRIRNIFLCDEDGKQVSIRKVVVGSTVKDNLLIVPTQRLKLDKEYHLFIPKGILESSDGTIYEEDIVAHFKTAKNVIIGTLKTDEEIEESEIKLENDTHTYITDVIGDKEFFFGDIEPGDYKIILVNGDKEEVFKYKLKVHETGYRSVKVYFNKK